MRFARTHHGAAQPPSAGWRRMDHTRRLRLEESSGYDRLRLINGSIRPLAADRGIAFQPPLNEVGKLMRERLRARLSLAQYRQRSVELNPLAPSDHGGSNSGRALPAGAAVQIDAPASLKFGQQAIDRTIKRFPAQPAVVGQGQAAFLDPGLGQR